MKNSRPFCCPIGITLIILLLTSTGMTQESPKEWKIGGTYWSAQRTNYPPLPYSPFPDLPVQEFAPGRYVYDDRDVDYVQLEAEASAASKASESEAGFLQGAEAGGGGSPMMMQGGGLCLLPPQFDGGNVLLNVAGATEGERHDVFVCTNLQPPVQWQFVVRGAPDQTNFSFAAPPGNVALFQLGTMQDTDGDTLTDAYETLVSFTDPNTADTVQTAGNNAALAAVLTKIPADLGLWFYTRDYYSVPNLGPCDMPNTVLLREEIHEVWTTTGVGGLQFGWHQYSGCDPVTHTAWVSNYLWQWLWDSNTNACYQFLLPTGEWSACGAHPDGQVVLPNLEEGWKFRRLTNDVSGGAPLSFRVTENYTTKIRLRTLLCSRGQPGI